MDDILYRITLSDIARLDGPMQEKAIAALERGRVIYFPNIPFTLHSDENHLLTEAVLSNGRKNVSFDHVTQQLAGAQGASIQEQMQAMMQRYTEFSKRLVDHVFPLYSNAIRWGRTSYRPAEIEGRATSTRKDDTRVHVDAFPATPVQGQRILRIFSNINPYGQARVWHLGEPFEKVVHRFMHQIPPYRRVKANLLKKLHVTKTLRTEYDHHMLYLHDLMKGDNRYQETLPKQVIEFPPYSTWAVFTDQVSHAALRGQYVLEQTFYLPVNAMLDPSFSPLKQLAGKKASELESV